MFLLCTPTPWQGINQFKQALLTTGRKKQPLPPSYYLIPMKIHKHIIDVTEGDTQS